MGTLLAERGMVVFGHDHLGHGESEGKRAYIENVDHYVDDLVQHCMDMQVLNTIKPAIKAMFDDVRKPLSSFCLFRCFLCKSVAAGSLRPLLGITSRSAHN